MNEIKEEKEPMKQTTSKLSATNYGRKVEKKVEESDKYQYKGTKTNPKGVKVPQKNINQKNVHVDDKM